jgi:adenylylsulfate kinase
MKGKKTSNITWHNGSISKEDRIRLSGHKGVCLWYTGLSASGKSTIAMKVEEKLFESGMRTFVLDGDNVRHGLNKNLGFSPEDRTENIRRIGEVSKLFVDAGIIVGTAFISPYRKDRDNVRKLYSEGEFVEIFIKADLETCEERDPKGLYKKALAGEIKEFTGISAPYEEPLNPELVINTTEETDIEKNADKVINYLTVNGYLIRTTEEKSVRIEY